MKPRSKVFLPRLLAGLLAGAALAACSQQSAEPAENCIVSPPAEPIACTMEYDPVCGCDGKDYSNACMARAAGVPRSRPGVCGTQQD